MATTIDDVALLARGMVEAQREVEEAEETLKNKMERLRLLREETIPCVMQELGLESLKLNTGQTLLVKDEVYGSVPKDDEGRDKAFQYLIDHDAASLIKTYVSVEFGKEEWERAMKLKRALIKAKFVPIIEQSVHPQTLKAWIRECLSNAEPIDLSIFNARSVPTAKLKG